MKKIRNILLIWAVIMTTVFIIQSCEKTPPIPACESGRWGDVTVKNSTGYNVWVDVTWGDVVENYEKLLYNGNTYKYNEIPAGSIEIWVSFDGNDWYYEYESLSSCESMTYTWYLSARKSTGCPFVLMLPNGEQVEPVLKTKE